MERPLGIRCERCAEPKQGNGQFIFPEEKHVVLLLGMHRGGTSAVAGAVHRAIAFAA